MEDTRKCPNIDFDVFFLCINEYPEDIDETELTYLDDKGNEIYLIFGYIKNCYWVGDGCDINGGTDFKTASELVNAPIYHGKSLIERWRSVHLDNFAMCPIDLWMKSHNIAM